MDLRSVTLCLAIVVSVGFVVCSGFDINSNLSVSGENANGQTLIDVGEDIDSPLLKLIGYAIRNAGQNLICHPCTDWTDWTTCSTKMDETFGSRMRTRACWQQIDGTSCTRLGEGTVEYKYEVCEGTEPPCPSHYNMTESGICFMFNETAVTRDEADGICQADGGYLMNIDTQERYDAVRNIGMWNVFTHVAGLRSAVGQPYVFEVGNNTLMEPFFAWDTNSYYGEPTNSFNELSLRVREYYGNIYWGDTVPTNRHAVLCEIRY